MKTRLFVVVFSIFMMPALSFAMIPTADFPGTVQSAIETVETTMSKVE